MPKVTRAAPPALPEGKYDVIVADPPWPNERVGSPTWQTTHTATSAYPRMTLKELNALPVGDLASDECLLVMWTTAMFLVDSIHLAERWGFSHIMPLFVWTKVKQDRSAPVCARPSIHYPKRCSEYVLVGRRGKAPISQAWVADTLWAPRTGHSRKPELFWEQLEAWLGDTYPRRIELFARDSRPGWDRWGLEAPPQ